MTGIRVGSYFTASLGAVLAMFTHFAHSEVAASREVTELAEVLSTAGVTPLRCLPSRLGKFVKNVVFLFEGRHGYTAQVEDAFRKLQFLEPVCRAVLEEPNRTVVDFSNGLSIDFYRLRDQLHGMGTSEGGSPVALKAFILGGLCKSSWMRFSDTEVRYLSSTSDLGQAKECALKMVQQPYANESGQTRFPSFSILGYSNGGHMALKFGRLMYENGVQVDLGFTVDPVPKNEVRVVVSALGDAVEVGKHTLGIRTSASDEATADDFVSPSGFHWVNYWQTSDNRVDHGLNRDLNLGLHGMSVANAEPNMRVTPPTESDGSASNGAHWRIFNDPLVMDRISKELTSVSKISEGKLSWRKD